MNSFINNDDFEELEDSLSVLREKMEMQHAALEQARDAIEEAIGALECAWEEMINIYDFQMDIQNRALDAEQQDPTIISDLMRLQMIRNEWCEQNSAKLEPEFRQILDRLGDIQLNQLSSPSFRNLLFSARDHKNELDRRARLAYADQSIVNDRLMSTCNV